MLNAVPTPPAARQPRGLVKLNGVVVPGWTEWSVDNNGFYQADTFRVTFAISKLPRGHDAAWMAGASEITVEIFAGFPTDPENFGVGDLQSVIYGAADDVTLEPTRGGIELAGRDLTARFIDTKTTEKWPNLTSSQIATQLAQRHGLTPVITATTTKAGTYYEIDHVRLADRRSEWDMLTWLAHQEQFSVYVKGQSLHFEPKPDPASDPYVLRWAPPTDASASPAFNGLHLDLSRNLTLAKDVIVKVHSWNAKNKKGFSQKAQATHNKNSVLAGAAQPTGEAQTYSYTIPGLTPEQALQRAQALLKEISAHELKLSARLPADDLLDITKVIQVEGTATAFDTLYFPDSIIRSMSADGGYEMAVTAKNHSPESVVTP